MWRTTFYVAYRLPLLKQSLCFVSPLKKRFIAFVKFKGEKILRKFAPLLNI